LVDITRNTPEYETNGRVGFHGSERALGGSERRRGLRPPFDRGLRREREAPRPSTAFRPKPLTIGSYIGLATFRPAGGSRAIRNRHRRLCNRFSTKAHTTTRPTITPPRVRTRRSPPTSKLIHRKFAIHSLQSPMSLPITRVCESREAQHTPSPQALPLQPRGTDSFSIRGRPRQVKTPQQGDIGTHGTTLYNKENYGKQSACRDINASLH
jgi:hypothetical protein